MLAEALLASLFIMPAELHPGPQGEPIQLAQDYGSGAPHVGGIFGTDPGQPQEDWSGSLEAWWDCEGSAGSNVEADDNSACPISSTNHCDLVETNTPSRDGTNFVEGTQSCSFAAASDEYVSCTNATCDELDLSSGDLVFGAWLRMTGSGSVNTAIRNRVNAAGGGGYQLYSDSGDDPVCIFQNDSSFSTVIATGAGALNTWQHVLCVFDDSTDEETIYHNASATTESAAITSVSDETSDFYLSWDNASFDWPGQIDEAFVGFFEPTAAQACRMCSCGISNRGESARCMCSAWDPTAYLPCTSNAQCRINGNTVAVCDTTNGTCSGLNNSSDPGCGGCSLTDCNAAAP